MEEYLLFFVLLFSLFSLIGWIKYKNIFNPITLFCGLWTIILFVYSLHLFELYYATSSVLWAIVIGVIMFFCGAQVRGLINSLKGSSLSSLVLKKNTAVFDVPNYKLMTIVNIISIVLLMGYTIATVGMLLSGISYETIHIMYQSEGGVVGALGSGIRLWHYFIWPWNLATIPMVVSCFMLDKKGGTERNVFLISSIINVALYILISGARASLAYFVFYFIAILSLLKRRVKLSIWQKILLVIILIIAWGVFNAISTSRNSASLENTIYTYVCGCVPYFSYRLEMFQSTGGVFCYGLHTFSGFLKPVFAVFEKLFGESDLWTQVLLNLDTQSRTYIAPHNSYNAFSSLFYFFYIDGGLLAVAVFSFFYGCFAVGMYNRFIQKKSYKTLVLYLLTAFGLAFSMVRFHFITLRYILSFIFTMLCFLRFRFTFKHSRN